MSQIVRALDNGWLRGAALDVFPEEPLPPQSVLWDHPKIIGRSFSSTKLRNSFPKLIAKTKLPSLWPPIMSTVIPSNFHFLYFLSFDTSCSEAQSPVTPHVAAMSRPKDIAECFQQNLAR